MRIQSLLFLSLVMILSACGSSNHQNRHSHKSMSMAEKRWVNQQTKRRGYGLIYPDYQAAKMHQRPSWANRPYNQPPRPVKPSWAK